MSGKFDLCEQSLGHNTFALGHGSATTGVPSTIASEVSPPIDIASLLHRCLDDTTFCGMILHKFAARAGDQLAALQRALESANIVELAREAHTLAGVAANLSAVALRDSADELERAATGSNLADARVALDRIRTEVIRCTELVPRLIERLTA
jgi:HPt (histidine-containing phosphotransfer) domain-containing protein